MVRQRPPLRGMAAVVFGLTVLALLVAGQRPAFTDDIDLLRFTTAKPYVFFILDNSASMSLSPDGKWVHANGDDPRSKIYQAKKVIYEVFKSVDDVHYGFAAFNQDYARVTAKHWLYYWVDSPSNKLPSDWPLDYPKTDLDGPIVTAANGTVSDDIEGDLMTFGAHLDSTGILGTCTAPSTFGVAGADDRETINRYSKLGATGSGPTRLWLKGGSGNKTYRLTVERPTKKADATTDNPDLGKDDMNVKLTLEQVNACTGPQAFTVQKSWVTTIELTLWTEFLMYDEASGRTAPTASKSGGVDYAGGFWDAKDIQDVATCGSGHPFSGKGWEGNYDTVPAASGAPVDPYCRVAGDPATCSSLKRATVADPDFGRALDKGDLIPFDWRNEQKGAFLQRFVPNYGSASPDFRIASYFKDSPDATTGVLPLDADDEIPLFASGPSPLGKSVIDFRCWYMGEGNKCNESAYDSGGWETIAAAKDSEWGCRRPYLIVLSDGGDSCSGENPCADTASLNSKSGVKTWVIAYGADCSKTGNPLKCMAQNGKGELLCPQTATDLKAELERILGLIRQEARSFASAAVPSVQAIVEDKIFLTNFTPLNGKALWDGHVHSFIKPLPLRAIDQKPDTTHPNHVWDAGDVMVATQVPAAGGEPSGTNANQRRVYYTQENTTDSVPSGRRLFKATTSETLPVKYDFWRALGYTFTEGDTASENTTQTNANAVVAETYKPDEAFVDVKNPITGATTTVKITYLLGDIFHSNPLVVGSPPNTQYYTLNLNGYQDFAAKHRLRRKMLIVGANDGMVHAFDAGQYSSSTDKFDNGTGKEVFGFMPRTVMPTVRLLADPTTTSHKWSVDGTLTVADTYIDPSHNGTPANADRQWRTVAIAGLRQGGSSYYALDITQPDTLNPGDDPGEDFVPQPSNGYVPSCLGEGSFNATACGPVPFPSVLWEFDDSVVTSSGSGPASRIQLDEEDTGFPSGNGSPDGNDKTDLGQTWSVPNVGRIKVATSTGSATTRDVYVSIFGGGLDPLSKTASTQGTWLYMVDIETGQAIYKRQIEGSMPSEPAAVDTNQDGYIDRIYLGTTQGYIYRIDLTADILSGTDKIYPALASQGARGIDNKMYTVKRVPTTSWIPKKIFNANFDAATGTEVLVARPIFFRPSVVFNSKLGAYLLAFGTGDRDDLWNNDGQAGRFYLFVDDTDKLSLTGPMTEANFTRVTVTAPATGGTLEARSLGQRGWYLVLDPNERVINDAFALSGVTFFSTFKPAVNVTTTKEGPQCAKTGVSRIFIVSTLNADPFVQPPSGVTAPPTRQFEVANFVTNPFAEQGQTKNASTGVAEICDDPTKMAIMESMKSLFPPTCKFSNYRVDIKTISADTSLVCIAPVPVCLIEKSWKEY
jgi:Tfp pilus tip-associated adhesin PilY1